MNATRLSKFMSLVLRHRARDFGLTLDGEGFAPLDEFAALVRERTGASLDELRAVVVSSQPQRFEIRDAQIRATYGHSRRRVATIEYPAVEPPEILYHGTHLDALSSIRAKGLEPRTRQYVHLSATRERASQVASRRTDAPVILTIRTRLAWYAGIVFHSPEPSRFLASGIPPAFIEPF